MAENPWAGARLGRGTMAPTARQVEILRVYVEAGSQRAAATQLGISAQTVKTTLASLRLRLDVDTTIQAAMILFAPAPSSVDDGPG
jgi:DNA-binding NarL/FixJ family response regulator